MFVARDNCMVLNKSVYKVFYQKSNLWTYYRGAGHNFAHLYYLFYVGMCTRDVERKADKA